MQLEEYLERMETTIADADAELRLVIGGHCEVTTVRIWHGQVLVDWEPDEAAGGCLLRPALLARLAALHAAVRLAPERVELTAPGRVVSSLSPAHADLVAQLGGAARVELRTTLRFSASTYVGGEEAYYMLGSGRGRSSLLLRLSARVRRHTTPQASPRTSRERR